MSQEHERLLSFRHRLSLDDALAHHLVELILGLYHRVSIVHAEVIEPRPGHGSH